MLLVTHGMGALNALNSVACAHAERSPLLVISGGPDPWPGPAARAMRSMPHQVKKSTGEQIDLFRHVTDLALRLENPEKAALTVALAAGHAMRCRLPVYLEIPTRYMGTPVPLDEDPPPETKTSLDRRAMTHALARFSWRIQEAQRPVLLLGVEVARYRLQEPVRRMMRARGMPAALTVLGKGALQEDEAGVLGVYSGVLSQDEMVRGVVGESDLVVLLGAEVADLNCGVFSADLHPERLLVASSGWIGDGLCRYDADIPVDAFVSELARILPRRSTPPPLPRPRVFDYARSDSLVDRMMGVIDGMLGPEHVVLADSGDACHGSLYLRPRRDNGYMAPTFYNAMGFAVPAAVGAQLAEPDARPVVLVGDGAFSMTGLELATAARMGLCPIVLLLRNGGLGMQQLVAGGASDDPWRWDYQQVPALVGGGRAWRISTPEELARALAAAQASCQGPSLIEVQLPRGAVSTGLSLLGRAIAQERTGHCPMAPTEAAPCTHATVCGFRRAAACYGA